MDYAELARHMVDLHTRHYGEMAEIVHHMSAGGEDTILHLLLDAHDDVFAEGLCASTGLSAGRVATLLKKLEARGLVERTTDESNRRRRLIRLTDRGRKAALEAESAMLREHEEVLRQLSEQDAQNLLTAISRLCEIYAAKGAEREAGAAREEPRG